MLMTIWGSILLEIWPHTLLPIAICNVSLLLHEIRSYMFLASLIAHEPCPSACATIHRSMCQVLLSFSNKGGRVPRLTEFEVCQMVDNNAVISTILTDSKAWLPIFWGKNGRIHSSCVTTWKCSPQPPLPSLSARASHKVYPFLYLPSQNS